MARQKKEKDQEGELSLLDKLERKYGINKISPHEFTIVPTGSIQLNQSMKIGGTALGKMYEIFGENSSGKTTLALHQIAEYQKAFPDKRVALLDYENCFDEKYSEAIGVDTDKLLIYQPDSQEQGYDLALGLIENELVSCIVIDSQTAAAPKAIINGEMGDSTIGLQARNNSKFCLKVKGLLNLHQVSLFWISQTRSNIGGYGDGQVTTGGNAIKFYCDARWKVWKQNDKDHESNKTTVDIVKSKIGKPFGQAKFSISWGEGIDKIGEVLSYAEDFGIIKRGGSWYSYEETKIGQGLENVKIMMEDNPEMYEEIRRKVLDKLKGEKHEELSIEQLLLKENESN